MTKSDEQKSNELEYLNLQYNDPNCVVSSTECTGLIQSPPITDEEANSFSEIYTMPKPKYEKPQSIK